MLVDIAQVAAMCRERDVYLVVDNTFATPIVQRPIELGGYPGHPFDDEFPRWAGAHYRRRDTGRLIHHAGTYLIRPPNGADGLTFQQLDCEPGFGDLAVAHGAPLRQRVDLGQLARRARGCRIRSLPVPGLTSAGGDPARRQMSAGGGLVTFTVAGGLAAGRRFLDALRLCDTVANLGDARTTVTHPASTTHSSLSEEDRLATGITPGLVRVSVGQHIDDIIADIDQALG